jgi:hypothetical protein
VTILQLNPPRSPLFQAALQLLAHEPDQLALITLLRDAFPRATPTEIQQALKETAVRFAAAGVRP